MKIIKKWLHDKLGWGFRGSFLKDGGLNGRIYECEFCNLGLIQDSQGNWFHLND